MELSDRRSRASQLRMRSIANLASDTPSPKRQRRRKEEGELHFLKWN